MQPMDTCSNQERHPWTPQCSNPLPSKQYILDLPNLKAIPGKTELLSFNLSPKGQKTLLCRQKCLYHFLSFFCKQEHCMQVPTLGCGVLDSRLKKNQSKKGHNSEKKMQFEMFPLIVWIVLWIVNTYSEFQENIFSNKRDITTVKVFARR